MSWALSILLLAVIAVLGVLLSNRSSTPTGEEDGASTPFVGVTISAQAIMNASELSVYRSLLQVFVPHGYQVFPQVAMSALIEITPNRQTERNRFNRKYVDFAVVRTTDWKCAIVVEVDGPMHESAKQKHRDATKDQALRLAGIPVKRLQAKHYTPEELAYAIGLPGAPGPGAPRSGR